MKDCSISTICYAFDLKRDAEAIKKKMKQDAIGHVGERRRTLPGEGTRKLMKSLKMSFTTTTSK